MASPNNIVLSSRNVMTKLPPAGHSNGIAIFPALLLLRLESRQHLLGFELAACNPKVASTPFAVR